MSILREFLWVIIVVGAIAALLFAVSGTWPAVVTIESESMVPHMNVGDLVFVVSADRFRGICSPGTRGRKRGTRSSGINPVVMKRILQTWGDRSASGQHYMISCENWQILPLRS